MTGKTHAIAAAATAIAILKPAQPETMLLGAAMSVLGGLTPDVDQIQSKMGRKVSRLIISIFSVLLAFIFIKQAFGFDLFSHLPMEQLISRVPQGSLLFLLLCSMGLNTKHRTFTHSLMGGGLFSLCAYLCFPVYWNYFFVGFATHILLDLLNKEGIEILFPFGKKASIPICHSGSPYANTFIVLVSACLIGIYLFQALHPA